MDRNYNSKTLFVSKHNQAKLIFDNIRTNYPSLKIDLFHLPSQKYTKRINLESTNKLYKFLNQLFLSAYIERVVRKYETIIVCPSGFIQDSFLGFALKNHKKAFILQSGFMYEHKNVIKLKKHKLTNNLIQFKKHLFKNQDLLNYLVHGEFFKSVLIESGIKNSNISIVGSPRIKNYNVIQNFQLSEPKFVYLCSSHTYEGLQVEADIEKKHLSFFNKNIELFPNLIIKTHPRGEDLKKLIQNYENLNFKTFDIVDISLYGNIVISNFSTANFEAINYGLLSFFLDDSNKLNFMNKKLLIKDLSDLNQFNTEYLQNYMSLISEQKEIAKKYIKYTDNQSVDKILKSINT
jgi:hypothetical protein